jgi:predicted nucleic acid-binding protein
VIILDTNILISLDQIRLDDDESYAASILSRAELEFGLNAAPSPALRAERTRRLAGFDAQFDWLPFDVESTRSYGIIAAGAAVRGSRVRGKDAMIAAQAHRHGAAVMTANLADFAPFAHLVEVFGPSGRPD